VARTRFAQTRFYVNDRVIKGDKFATLASDPSHDFIVQSVLYNSSAYVETKEDMRKVAKGNVTECGLINYLIASSVDCEELISHRKRPNFLQFDIPFDSGRKRATSVVMLPNGDIRVFVKGAPEVVVEMCDHYHTASGIADLEKSKKKQIVNETVKEFAKKCYRTLLVAYLDIHAKDWESWK
jgi:magnesium-transporting ATPase (P-type)